MDETGKKHVEVVRGFAAQVFQHEIDHLNGILYIDRLPSLKQFMHVEEYKKHVLKMG